MRVEKGIAAASSPGWFDSMEATDGDTFELDLKLGQGTIHGSSFNRNSDGTFTGFYVSKLTFSMDEKSHAPKGTFKGTWEITRGTGRFANIRGHLTDKGEFGEGHFIDHWTGAITGLRNERRRSEVVVEGKTVCPSPSEVACPTLRALLAGASLVSSAG